MVANSEKDHKSKLLAVVRRLTLDLFSLFLYCMTKCPLHVTSAQVTTQDTLHMNWCLLNVNNISDVLKIAWKKAK